MPTRTNATDAADGIILDPSRFARHATLARETPNPALDPWVEHYWSVHWELPAAASYRSSTVPVSACNLTVEHGGCAREQASGPGVFVTGVVSRARFDVRLTDVGGVVGVKFRPGGFTALTGIDAASLRDRVRRAVDLLPGTESLAGLRPEDPSLARRLDDYLTGIMGRSDENYPHIQRVIDTLDDAEPTITAAQLAGHAGLTLRTLQRLCRRYLGVGPQWLIARARVHAAVARLHAGDDCTLAEIATELGWFDQAHMGRDFATLIGESPGAYRDRQRAHGPSNSRKRVIPAVRH